MPKPGKSVIGGEYARNMTQLSGDYTALINQAESVRIGKGGEPSREEAELMAQAAKTCDQIIGLSLGLRDVRVQWEVRKKNCEARVKEIVDKLAPPPPPKAEVPAAAPAGGSAPQAAANTDTVSGAAIQTGTGFTTRNANDAVSAETIESWYQKRPAAGFDDLVGMRDLKQRLMNEVASMGWSKTDAALGISPVQSYFLYGPPGTGKTQLIEAFAGAMMDKGFKFLKLTGSQIHDKYVGGSEKIVTAAFNEAIDAATQNPGCIIFIDEVESVCVNRAKSNIQSYENKLTDAFLEARNELRKSGKRVVFFGATNHPKDVDPAMMDSVHLVRLPLPDREAREEYFRQLAFKKLTLEPGFTCGDMAEETENFSFRELLDLKNSVMVQLREQLVGDRENWVLNEQGERDQEKTDEKISALIETGTVTLGRELFLRQMKELGLPKDKSAVMAELTAFEQGVAVS